MKNVGRRFGAPEALILAGCCLFLFALWLSAWLDPTIRWLHFFQAWMCLATIVLALRRNRWGYFLGISAGFFWDYVNVFTTTFLRSGLHWLSVSLQEGRILHVDQVIAVPAWVGNFLIVIGGVWAYGRLPVRRPSDLGRLAVALVLTTGFLAVDMALFQPRYLGLFPALLHPLAP